MPAVRAAGIEWATWHDCRHTFASRLAIEGHSETTIASLLRHSTNALVRRYAHLSQTHLKSSVETVASFGKSDAFPRQISSATVTGTGKAAEESVQPTVEVVEK